MGALIEKGRTSREKNVEAIGAAKVISRNSSGTLTAGSGEVGVDARRAIVDFDSGGVGLMIFQ